MKPIACELTAEQLFVLVLSTQQHLPMLVVYRPVTSDQWLARLWYTDGKAAATSFIMTAGSLDGLRDMMPETMVMLARSENDDPTIEEVWL